MKYNKINNIVGWIAFGIALITYWMTMAPTASFWDCGEFISCANELEVPHPPGPPIYLLLGRVMSFFAFSNVENIAYMVNLLSVLSGALTVLFTFWIITALAKKVVTPEGEEMTSDKLWITMFAGMVGALSCTFADSIWFNTVEAEVYAMSSLCTAAVVWLAMKWDARHDSPENLKWIVMIAFVIGLSIGVHLLNLLAIPFIMLVIYFRKPKYFRFASLLVIPMWIGNTFFKQNFHVNWENDHYKKFNWEGFVISLVFSVVGLGFVQYGIIQYTIELIWPIEEFLVGVEKIDGTGTASGLGLPMGTGVFTFVLLFAGLITAALWYTGKKNLVIINTLILSQLMIFVGYSTYIIIGIRANTDVTINENTPGDVVSMLSYMKREQYGDRPLFYGVLYNDVRRFEQVKGDKSYMKVNEEYWFPLDNGTYKTEGGKSFTIKNGKTSDKIEKGDKLNNGNALSFDSGSGKVLEYRKTGRYIWQGYKIEQKYPDRNKILFPRMYSSSHYEKSRHLYGYQRFVKNQGSDPGPDDDKPTMGEDKRFFFEYQLNHMYWRYFLWNFAGREGDKQDDDWETGLNFSKTSKMPEVVKNDPGKNHYYALPFLLGLFGMVWHFVNKSKDATAVAFLFFFTGIAIVIYLNQPPSQPRERDYSYAGSFQTWAIWIGLGVIGVWDLLRKYLKGSAHWVVGAVCLLLVPGIMAKENWNDHSRHVRYVAPDSAYNLLNSCAKNAIIFTNGDNDTFPLWYLQEVEGVRTDVRVVNLSLLNTDWYVNQMRKQANESAPLPISLKESDYMGEQNAVKAFATQVVNVPVDKAAVVANGTVRAADADKIVSPLPWSVKARGPKGQSYLLKQDYMILDIIRTNAANGWERPIYFSSTIPPSSYMNLMDYFNVEGLAYRVMPIKMEKSGFDPYQHGVVDIDRSYELITKVFKYRELNNPSLYLDEHIRRTIIGNLRSTIYRTSNAAVEEANNLRTQENALKGMIAQIAADGGNPATADSLQAQLRATTAKIQDYSAKASEMLVLMEENMPGSIVENEPVFELFCGNSFFKLGEKERALEYYRRAEDRVTQTLNYHAEIGEPFKNEDRYLSALDLAARYYDQYGAIEDAVRVAELLVSYTRDAQQQAYLNILRQKLQTQKTAPTVNDSASK